jgi:hypothetical protein
MKRLARSLFGKGLYETMREKYHTALDSGPDALPAFIIVGTQKGGTSSLYSYLCTHPEVWPATKKEVHFFDNHFSETEEWYRSHFPSRLKLKLTGRITGEASPYYLFHPLAPRRMADVAPKAKLIMLLRNPVKRAISHYLARSKTRT